MKTKKKRISHSSKPKSLYKVRFILPKKQVAETQYAEVTVATTDATKSLVASELAEEQVNQPSAAEAEKENTESPYDTESEIKIIKSYQATTISGSLFIYQSSLYDQDDQDVIDIIPKDTEKGDASESFSSLRSMLDDDLASMTSFETQDSADHVSKEGTKTLHAFADKPAQSDPFGHLHEELCLPNNKLHGLLSDALKDNLPQLIKDSIKSSVTESIAKELPQVKAQVQKNLQDQLPNILVKPMYKEFNAFNNLESQRFVLLQKELSKSLYNKIRKSIRPKDLWIMFKDMGSLLKAADVFKRLMLMGRRAPLLLLLRNVQEEQPSAQVVPNAGQVPIVNEEKLLVLHTLEEKSSLTPWYFNIAVKAKLGYYFMNQQS
ncbi:hypothetical protein Tco_1203956 [Tanacetum coccineum]